MKDLLLKANRKDGIMVMILTIILVLLVMPFIIVSMFGTVSADDFTNLVAFISSSNDSFLMDRLNWTIYVYKGWQGTYTGNFLSTFNGYYFHGMLGLHIEFILNIILFFISILVFCQSMIKKTILSDNRLEFIILVTVISMFLILYDYNPNEVFYWHTGLAMYTIPLSIGLLSISLSILYDGNVFAGIFSVLLSFISVGGALDVAALVCTLNLLLLCYKLLQRKPYRLQIVVFCASFIGALINVVAPGNYIRHSDISTEFNVFEALIKSFEGVVSRNWELAIGGTIPLFFLMGILMYNWMDRRRDRYVNPIVLFVALLIGEIIVDFPVRLGYSSGYFPLRCEFVARCTAVIFILIFEMNLVGGISSRSDKLIHFDKQYVSVIVLVTIMSITPFVSQEALNNYYPFRIYQDLANGELDKYEDTNNLIISRLMESKGENVVIEIFETNDVDYLASLRLQEDPEYWVNKGTASYFENESISVIYK